LFNREERTGITAIDGVEELQDLSPPLSRGLTSLGPSVVARLSPRLRYSVPVIQVLQARFRKRPGRLSATQFFLNA
jgi:hypothetical protein